MIKGEGVNYIIQINFIYLTFKKQIFVKIKRKLKFFMKTLSRCLVHKNKTKCSFTICFYHTPCCFDLILPPLYGSWKGPHQKPTSDQILDIIRSKLFLQLVTREIVIFSHTDIWFEVPFPCRIERSFVKVVLVRLRGSGCSRTEEQVMHFTHIRL